MVGDLILFSPCLKILKDNFQNSHITLVCSEYNYQVAKNYKQIDKFLIIKKRSLFKNAIKHFKSLFLTKYNYLFQFDGKNSSYLISYFVRSRIKSTVCFVKKKKNFFNIKYKITRPMTFLLKIFYNNFIYSYESYDDDNIKLKVNYQKNYFNLLKSLNLKITSERNIFNLSTEFKVNFDNFYTNQINEKFYIFHFDEKWNNYKQSDYNKYLEIITKFSLKHKIIITTGIKNFIFYSDLIQKFPIYNFSNNKIQLVKDSTNKRIIILDKLPLNLLAYFIKNSEKNISTHSGPIVHISSAFNKSFIDVIPNSKNFELDRWIPITSDYKRINFENINKNFIDNLTL